MPTLLSGTILGHGLVKDPAIYIASPCMCVVAITPKLLALLLVCDKLPHHYSEQTA